MKLPNLKKINLCLLIILSLTCVSCLNKSSEGGSDDVVNSSDTTDGGTDDDSEDDSDDDSEDDSDDDSEDDSVDGTVDGTKTGDGEGDLTSNNDCTESNVKVSDSEYFVLDANNIGCIIVNIRLPETGRYDGEAPIVFSYSHIFYTTKLQRYI